MDAAPKSPIQLSGPCGPGSLEAAGSSASDRGNSFVSLDPTNRDQSCTTTRRLIRQGLAAGDYIPLSLRGVTNSIRLGTMSRTSPVALFVYNRVDSTRRVFGAIAAARRNTPHRGGRAPKPCRRRS